MVTGSTPWSRFISICLLSHYMKDTLLRLPELISPKPNRSQVLNDVVIHTLNTLFFYLCNFMRWAFLSINISIRNVFSFLFRCWNNHFLLDGDKVVQNLIISGIISLSFSFYLRLKTESFKMCNDFLFLFCVIHNSHLEGASFDFLGWRVML